MTTTTTILTGNELTGAISGTITQDMTLVGNISLLGDLTVTNGAVLSANPGVIVEGNGFQINMINGASVNWRGTPKSAWVMWGQNPSGWLLGDLLAVAPLATGDYDIHYDTWTGSWSDVSPSTSVLSNGLVVKAEVANLSQDIVFRNLSRIIFQDGAGPSVIKFVTVVNSGDAGSDGTLLGMYPLHWHVNHETTRGTFVEGVTVVNGGRHAFVPHGSDGITFTDVAAINTIATAYWWDKPSEGDRTNNSQDIVFQHALSLGVENLPNLIGTRRMSGFQLGAGLNLTCIDCHSSGVKGRKDASGFIWPEFTGGGDNNEGVWDFRDAVGHNNLVHGIFVWQNTRRSHTVFDTLLYRNGNSGIDHGAYHNMYLYQNIRSYDNGRSALELHSNSRDDGDPGNLRFFDFDAVGSLFIGTHQKASELPVIHRNCSYDGVIVREDLEKGSTTQHFEDCGLIPSDFDLQQPHADTVLKIFENGQLLHEWSNGSWSQTGLIN